MKLRRFLDLRPPLFVIGILLIMGTAVGIGLGVDRLIKWYREKSGLYRQPTAP